MGGSASVAPYRAKDSCQTVAWEDSCQGPVGWFFISSVLRHGEAVCVRARVRARGCARARV